MIIRNKGAEDSSYSIVFIVRFIMSTACRLGSSNQPSRTPSLPVWALLPPVRPRATRWAGPQDSPLLWSWPRTLLKPGSISSLYRVSSWDVLLSFSWWTVPSCWFQPLLQWIWRCRWQFEWGLPCGTPPPWPVWGCSKWLLARRPLKPVWKSLQNTSRTGEWGSQRGARPSLWSLSCLSAANFGRSCCWSLISFFIIWPPSAPTR